MATNVAKASLSTAKASLSTAKASLSTASLSIAQRDKQLMDLQHQIELKEAQLKQDYQRLLRDVKQNPYLQVALDEYNRYFKKEKTEKDRKIKALTDLLQQIENKEDQIEIKREIMHYKRK